MDWQERIEILLTILICAMIVIIGLGYVKGVNQIGDALTQHQIEKYSTPPTEEK